MLKQGGHSETRSRLYIKMLNRFSEKFGEDERSIKIINNCLSSKLINKDKIDPKDLDEVQEELQRKFVNR